MTGHGGPNGGIILRNNDGSAMTKSEVIILRRGAFKWLPVLCSNDLVHGSWWFFWGAIISAVFAIVPLIQQYETFYHQHDDLLPAGDFKETWGLLIASGILFALGSLAFVRAFDEPPQRALFYYFRHLQTDELLGAWLFLLGTAPAVPYSFVFFSVSPSVTYMGMILVSILFLFGCVLFVLGCYPSDRETENYLLPLCIRTIGARMWVVRHLANDWLAGTWFLYWANVLVTIISILFFIVACSPRGTPEAIFIWFSGSLVSFLFLVGSAYFVAGSYPHATQFYYIHDRGGTGKRQSILPSHDGKVHLLDDGRHAIIAPTIDVEEGEAAVAPTTMEFRKLDNEDTVNPIHHSGSSGTVSSVNPQAGTSNPVVASGQVQQARSQLTPSISPPLAQPTPPTSKPKEKKKKKKPEKVLNAKLASAASMTVVNPINGLPGLQHPHSLLNDDDDDDDDDVGLDGDDDL